MYFSKKTPCIIQDFTQKQNQYDGYRCIYTKRNFL